MHRYQESSFVNHSREKSVGRINRQRLSESILNASGLPFKVLDVPLEDLLCRC